MENSRSLQDFLDRPSLTNRIGNTGGQVVRFRPAGCLCIDTDRVFGTTCTSETPSLVVPRHEGLDLGLEARRRLKLTLRIISFEDGAISNLNTYETGGKVCVSSKPFLGAPRLVGEDSFNQEHVRDSITDRLVDQVSETLQTFNRALLGRGLRLGALNGLQGVLRESNGTMAVGFKVNANVEAHGGMVKMFNTGVGTDGLKLQHFFNVIRAGAIRVGGLNDTNLEVLRNTSTSGQIANEGGGQSGNAITVKEAEDVALINKIVDQTVRVTVQGGATVESRGLRRWRSTLFGLHKIGTALIIKS